MTFEILLIIVIILYFILNKTKLKKYNENNILFYMLTFAIFTIMQGFRAYSIGTDTKHYIEIYNIINDSSWLEILSRKAVNIEIGFGALMKFMAIWNLPARYFLIIIAMIINGGFIYFIYKNSKNPLLSILIFMGTEFFTLSFTALRQMTAVVIILYAYMFIKEKKNIKAFLTIILASFFHTTALIFMPVILFNYIKINKKSLAIIVGLFLVMQVIGMPIVQWGIENTPYAKYLAMNVGSGGETQLLVMIIYTIIGIVLYYKNEKKGTNNILILIMITSIYLQSFACRIQLIGRLTWYFYIFNTIYLPNLIVSIEETNKRKNFNIIFGGINIIQFLIYSINSYNINPYIFIQDI